MHNSTRSYLTVTDQFCGAGGSSIGAVAAGAELRLALNHWQLAIETHNSNFPDAAHDCTDISACDPRRYPSTDILITSPECTNHSLAKGKRKVMQTDLFGNSPDPAEERSRATMWDVPRFTEVHKYNVIVVENVVDARKWVNWTAWLLAMRQLGYDHKAVYFNSMFAHPTPQSRDRMYVVFWRKGNRAPNLDIRPAAWCEQCSANIEAVQAWKNGRRAGRYIDQYVYACPHCMATVRPYYYCAASAIDWTLPIERIGDRKKPLKEKTLARIRAGLEKFGRQAMTVDMAFGSGDRATMLADPLRTQTTRQTMALVVPYYSTGTASSTDEPLPTVTTVDRHALVIPPFLLGYYTRLSGQRAAISGVDEPMPTQSTQPRHYLVQPNGVPDVTSCGFRMLQPHEIQAAMAFPADYKVKGNKRDQVRQLGNAVTPPAMGILMQRIVESFN